MFKLLWRWQDECADARRVWRADWPGDMFEVVDSKQFAEIKSVCDRFSIPLIKTEDD